MSVRVLHQFPVSHFCEKARWLLDAKGLAYRVLNQLPGVHALINLPLSGVRTVPLLREGKQSIGDSTAIALHLEQQYPQHPMLPQDAAQRAKVLELDLYFNRAFGREVRRLCYGMAMRHPGATRQLFFDGYAGRTQKLGPLLMGAVFERQLRQMYRIHDAGMEESERGIREGSAKLEQLLNESGSGYLVGDKLSLADVTAASLLAPLVGPPNTPWADISSELTSLHERRAQARDSVAGRWLLGLYARERPRSAQLA